MTDTPETDAACDAIYSQGVAHIPLVGFMEKLERERDEERALADRLALALKMTRWDSPVTCKKAFDAWKERRKSQHQNTNQND